MLLAVCLGLVGTQASGADAYHFVNGHLITGLDGEPAAEPLELTVSGERITAVGADLASPESAVRIDLDGGYLIPGLTEMHAHVPAPDQGDTYRDEVLFLYLANGITTIRGMLGHPDHLRLREDIAAHTVLGPRLFTSGPSFNGSSVSGPDEARQMVADQAAAGYDFLKIHPGLTLAEYDAMSAAAHGRGIPFAGHVPAEVGLLHALAGGQASIDHLDGYVQALVPGLSGDDSGLFAIGLTPRADGALIGSVVAETVAAGAAVVPTETLLENFAAADPESVFDRPQNVYLPPDLRERYRERLTGTGSGLNRASAARFLELRKTLIRALHDSGALMLLGSDAPQIYNVPGFSAHRELTAMVAAGLTPAQALVMGTRNPAIFFGQETEFGQLKPGMAADLVWLRENPLDGIAGTTTIEGVMVRGHWLDRAELDAGLAAIAARNTD